MLDQRPSTIVEWTQKRKTPKFGFILEMHNADPGASTDLNFFAVKNKTLGHIM